MDKYTVKRIRQAKAKLLYIQQQINCLTIDLYEAFDKIKRIEGDVQAQSRPDSDERWAEASLTMAGITVEGAAQALSTSSGRLLEAVAQLNLAAKQGQEE